MATPLGETCAAFLKLGLISFGGPVAHLGYFREEFVHRRKWLRDESYADLVSLCQFLPGPASSQVVFAIGMQRAGLIGAVAASLCFMLPSVVLMIAFAYGLAHVDDVRSAGWLHGLKLAAVVIVAQAVWAMGRSLCPDRPRITIGILAAVATLAFPFAFVQIAVIAGAGALGWLIFRHQTPTSTPIASPPIRGHAAALAALIVFVSLLVTLPALASATGSRSLAMFDSFYRSGSLVFGGGHVVLPLLRSEVVPPGWVDDGTFLAGYGAAQAVPGPLFTFAAFLGTVMHGQPHAWIGGLWCTLAIFLPAWLLIGGSLPFWDMLRTKVWAQSGLKGANAGVVGILLAALYTPVFTHSVSGPRDVAAILAAFVALQIWRLPVWVIVLTLVAAGQWVL